MDELLAKKMESELKGETLHDWTIESLINSGKSAAVFKASDKHGKHVAIKFFDNDIVLRAGKAKQLERIEREKKLIGQEHENLIKIFGGGEWTDKNLLYVVMEYVPYENLYKANSSLLPCHIPGIVKQIALACEFLEKIELAHRDIKPENIVISKDASKVIVLDLGVLHPLDLGDEYEKNKDFVATLRYSPPELLLRIEKEEKDAWRAITFYQLGAVIFELLTKERLFEKESEPYANLVNAVQHSIPILEGDYPRSLVNLALACLSKNPEKRLSLVQWESFFDIDGAKITRENVRAALSTKSGGFREPGSYELKMKLYGFSEFVVSVLKSICTSDASCFPPHTVSYIEDENVHKRGVIVSFWEIQKELSFFLEAIDTQNNIFSITTGDKLIFQGSDQSKEFQAALESAILDHLYSNLVGDKHE